MKKDDQIPDDPLIPDHPDEDAEIEGKTVEKKAVDEPVDEPTGEDSSEEKSGDESDDEISLPSPHLKDGDGSATYRNETSIARRTEEWGAEYEHPLDSFSPTPKTPRISSKGCLAIGLGIVLLVSILLVVGFSWATTGRFVKQGYEVVRLTEKESVISQSPDVPTCYIGRTIDVRIPKCSQPIAVIGTDVTLRGDFLIEAHFMAFNLHATQQSRFARNFEIYALQFFNESETILGRQEGFTFRETLPEPPPQQEETETP